MLHTTHRIRRTAASLAVAAATAALAVPTALAGGNSRLGPPDGWYTYAVSLTKQHAPFIDGRSPDTRDAALAAQVAKYGPRDGWFGYAVSLTKWSRNSVLDGRSPDT